MARPRSVALYARISSDQEQHGLGVARQLADCRARAESLGWAIGDEYVDNDLSAYSGKRRPEYERMLEDIRDGVRDGVIAYHVDRLTRRPIELEHFVEVLTAAGVKHFQLVAGGDVDLASGDSLLVLRITGAVAANESASKSRRVKRKLDEVAAAGMPHGGSRRPYGYEADRITIRPSEAGIIRTLAQRFLAGESLHSLAVWLDEEGIVTVHGSTWRTGTVRQILVNPRNAGLRKHRGEIVGPAVWDPIFGVDTLNRIVAEFERRKTSGRRAPRRYLLSGLLRCGKCNSPLYSAARVDRRRYVCMSGPDHGGCGGIQVNADPVEELITEAVLYRLDTPALAEALSGRAAGDQVAAALADELADDQRQLEELAGMYARKDITSREWMSARKPIQDRITVNERQLARATRTDTLAGLAGNGRKLRKQWADLNLDRQARIVAAVLDHAIIRPFHGTGQRVFQPDRVEPIWRL